MHDHRSDDGDVGTDVGTGALAARLVPLPPQPADVPWPTSDWPTGTLPGRTAPRVEDLIDTMFDDPVRYGDTYAVLAVVGGRLVAERYGGALPHFERPPEPVTPETRLASWSMAKSILHAAVGVLVGRGELTLDARAPVAEWADADDPRHSITLEHLLCMRDGLDFAEDYVDAGVSNVIEMLFGAGRHDTAAYAASRPLAHTPGTVFNYSSGTSNIVSRIVAGRVGTHDRYAHFLRRALFDPIGMGSAEPRFDDAGTFVGSSYVSATARDFAKFGLLYLRGGAWDRRVVLPAGWVDHGRRPRSRDPEEGRFHGAHWWVVGDDLGTFWASGYEGQSIVVCPALDLVAVRLGRSDRDQYPALAEWRTALVDVVRAGA